jgi:hypothetical protein
MLSKSIILDANILIRAVLGNRVRQLLEAHSDTISFFVPQSALAEAEEHLAGLVIRRQGDPAKALRLLRAIAALGNSSHTGRPRHLRRNSGLCAGPVE